VPGSRTLTIGGLSITVAADGTIAEKDLPALAALPETAVTLETLDQASPVPLTGTLSLADQLTTATVPASAVVADGSLTCVSTGRSTAKVRVVSSQLGQSVISFGTATPPSSIDTQPDPTRTCG
jgi:hypothetical protein